MAKQILIADDEANLRRVLGAQLQRDGYEVLSAEDGEQALALIKEHHVDVVISDLKMPKIDGLTLLKRLAKEEPGLPVILITAHGTVDTAVEALKAGAFDYVTKPFDRAEFRAVVDKAARTSELGSREVVPETLSPVGPNETKGRFRLIGNDPAMVEVYTIVDRVAGTPSTVLITGESGTGKELIARAVHENSPRKDKPFIRVNCAAIPRDLLESELFGYEKGAFTGAVTSKPGRFELAHGGTLFLDEIGEISVEMQVKLLRAIQEQEFERVGGIKTIQVDVRLVAATNSTLLEKIKEGKFREDLYYRLNVVQVRLPPLRERKGDIPLLVEHFLARFRERLGKPKVQSVGPEAMELLLGYGWPGNIRELENVIERCTLFCDGERVEKGDLPPDLLRATQDPVPSSSPGQVDAHRAPEGIQASDESHDDEEEAPGSGEVGLKAQVKEAIAKVERDLIVRALGARNGNVTHTARDLKISRKSLQTKMKELGLREPKEE
jgi:two-component system response regulator AtoC